MATQTPLTTRLPEPQTHVPEPGSTLPPSHGMTFATQLPGVPVWVRGSQGASGAQFGPLRPGAHLQSGGVPTRLAPHDAGVTMGLPPCATQAKLVPLPVNLVPAGHPQTFCEMVPPEQVIVGVVGAGPPCATH